MSYDELDFDKDFAKIADAQAAGAERHKTARATSKAKTTTSRTAVDKEEVSLGAEIANVLGKIADQAEAKGDVEMADVLREEKENISHGFIALTHAVKALRRPLIFILGVVVPLIAFWRIGGLLLFRLAERRQAKKAERQSQAPGFDGTA